MGRLYEAVGDLQKAIAHYKRFVYSAWKLKWNTLYELVTLSIDTENLLTYSLVTEYVTLQFCSHFFHHRHKFSVTDI